MLPEQNAPNSFFSQWLLITSNHDITHVIRHKVHKKHDSELIPTKSFVDRPRRTMAWSAPKDCRYGGSLVGTAARCRRSLSPELALEQKYALTGRRRVEAAVGLVGLLDAPAVGEDALEVDLVVGDEARAFEHAHGAEGPRADQRDLAAQEIGADVQSDVAALADVAGAAPGLDAAHGGAPCGRGARAFERERDAFAPRQVLDRLDGVLLRRIDERVGAEVAGETEALGGGLHGDDTRAHRVPEQRGREPDRTLAEDRQRVAPRDSHPAQRRVRGAGAARHGCAFSETQFFWK